MSFRTEAQFHVWFKAKICRPLGAYCQKIQAIGLRGYPDLTVVHRGTAAFYEVKIAKGDPSQSRVRPTPIQQVTLRNLAEAGGRAYGLLVSDERRVALWDPLTGFLSPSVVPSDPLLWTCPPSEAALNTTRWV